MPLRDVERAECVPLRDFDFNEIGEKFSFLFGTIQSMEDAVFIPIYQSGASYKINPNLQNFSIRNASPTMAYKYFDKK